MKLLVLICARPVGSLVLCMCLAVLGVGAVIGIPVYLYPQIRYPAVTITTLLADADPEEIEALVTRKIEETVADIPGVKRVSSVSREGKSEVTLEFVPGKDVSGIATEVRGRLRRLFPSLPRDTRFPLITHFNPADDPVMLLGVAGRASLADLSHWAEHVLKPHLNRIPGVAGVQVTGTAVVEIQADCDAGRLKALGLSVHEIVRVIGTANRTQPAGSIDVGDKRIAIRTTGSLETSEEMARQPLRIGAHGGLLTIADVARLREVNREPKEITRLNGESLVSLAVYRSVGADVRQLCADIRARLGQVGEPSESGIRVRVIYDQADRIEEALDRFKGIIGVSGAVAGCTLFLFLGRVASTLVILAAIPFSILVTLLLMHASGMVLDLFSLTGLSLAVGIVVDSSIVVMEAIATRSRAAGSRSQELPGLPSVPVRTAGADHDASQRDEDGQPSPRAAEHPNSPEKDEKCNLRHREEHRAVLEVIVEGTSEVAVPLLFATVVIMAAFLPLVLVSPQLRIYFVGLTAAVCVSLWGSLAAALVLVPLLFRYFSRMRFDLFSFREQFSISGSPAQCKVPVSGCVEPTQPALGLHAGRERWTRILSATPSRLWKRWRRPGFDVIEAFGLPRAYAKVLAGSMRHPAVVGITAVVFLAVSWILATRLPYRQDWGIVREGFRVHLVMKPGTATQYTLRETEAAERIIRSLSGVETVHSRVQGNQGKIEVTLKKHCTATTTAAHAETLKELLPRRTQAQSHVLPLSADTNLRVLSVSIAGPGLDRLVQYANEARKVLVGLPGVLNVLVHQGNQVPQVEFPIQHDLIGSSGVRAMDLASDMRARLTGPVATRVIRGEREILVRVRTAQDAKEGLRPLQSAHVRTPAGVIPYTELVRPTTRLAPSEIHRENRGRVVRMTVYFERAEDPTRLAEGVSSAMRSLPLAEGYSYALDEEIRQIVETRREMVRVVGLALLLIYLILVAATESFLLPLLITASAPFAVAGVFLALAAFGYAVNLPVYMGMVVLCGLMTSAGILLVYAMDERRRQGLSPEQAAEQGAMRRLRPILMTTAITLITALPVLCDRGTGSSTWVPFAMTVTAGLTVSALFSLVLTPAIYPHIVRLEQRIGNARGPFVRVYRKTAQLIRRGE
ncbi:MAG: efflux RND transporter permease subunit [Thermodesulfobacteriota bacterium]